MLRLQRGFTLIEVLISILVLSVGVLGVTGLQLIALDANRDALLRSEANQLANDIVDRIEVNSNTAYGPVNLGDAPPAGAVDCVANACTPVQMRDYDLAVWMCSVNPFTGAGVLYNVCANTLGVDGSRFLPNGQASLSINGSEYTVVVAWRSARASQTSSVTMVFQI